MIYNKGKKIIGKWFSYFILWMFLCMGAVSSVWAETLIEENLQENTDGIQEGEEDQPSVPELDAEDGYTITFIDSMTEAEITLKAKEDEALSIPMPEVVEGYRSIGWAEEADAKEASYLGNLSYQMDSDLVLYSVREKEYQLTFLTNTGKTTDRLAELTITGVAGETVTLPKLPVYSGYTSFGWTTEKSGTQVTHKEESSYTIMGDASFYQINGHVVTFYNNKGTSQYTAFATTTVGNAYITMPKLPDITGYEALGWTTVKGASVAKFKAGGRVWIKRTVPLYAVYKKVPTYTVKFYTYAGGYEYQQYRLKVNSGTTITLPALPRKLNYANIGWGTVKSPKESQVKKAGTKITVTSNLKFYIYRKEATTIRFMYNNGSGEYMSLRMDVTGSMAVLPSMKSPRGYLFLGWSDKPNKSSYPNYQMGQKITPVKGMKLYSVLMKAPLASDENIKTSSVYDTVFFIGDSRTVHMESTVQEALGADTEKVKFFCKSGQGIAWLEENQQELLDMIKDTKGKKAVVFNLGVNNLKNHSEVVAMANRYAKVMKSMAASLKSSKCNMYFMSVNPVNPKECTISSYKRQPESVKYFNYLLHQKLSDFTYIDTYNYLIKTGFELRDGLHYTDATYRKIYNKAITVIDW